MEDVKEPKPKIGDEVRAQITGIAAKATATERQEATDLVERATGADYEVEDFTFSPGIAALIFLENNAHNRDWSPQWTLELARRMKTGQWRKNNAIPGFYNTGALEDGQHRLAAVALADIDWDTKIVFGIDPESIASVDAGKKRYGADAAQLEGVLNTKIKQTILRTSANYLVKAGFKDAAIKSEFEMSRAIQKSSDDLDTAIDIAKESAEGIVTPILRPVVAAAVALLMLQHGWAPERIREQLPLMQSGQSTSGGDDPFFVAADLIARSRDKANLKERLNAVKEVGLVILAMDMTEHGVGAVRKTALMASLKKSFPNPTYNPPVAQAAE